MSFITLGINHKSAAVDVREKVAFSSDTMNAALQSLQDRFKDSEHVILSTCNRTELYIKGEDANSEALLEWLADFHGVEREKLASKYYALKDEQAVSHLMHVACGLDSLIIGEPQILGQLKLSFTQAKHAGSVSSHFEKLFQKTFQVAKQVRTETEIGDNAVSVAFTAVQLAKHIFSNLSQSRVLLIGAGETIELVATHLKQQGVSEIVVANRTIARGSEIAEKFSARATTLSQLNTVLADSDIVISSTASQLPLVGKGMVETALKQRRNKPMLFVDLAVPRDIEQEVNDLDGVYLYSIDDLQDIVEQNIASRESAAEQAKSIIAEQVDSFSTWQKVQQHVDVVKLYRDGAEQERSKLLSRAKNQIEDGQDIHSVLEELTNKLTNSLLHKPTKALKTAAEAEDKNLLNKLVDLFGLDRNK